MAPQLRLLLRSIVFLPMTLEDLRSLIEPATATLDTSLTFKYDLQRLLVSALSGEDGAAGFWCPPGGVVPRVDARTLSPLEFHRSFVSRNTPVILTNLMNEVMHLFMFTSPLIRSQCFARNVCSGLRCRYGKI